MSEEIKTITEEVATIEEIKKEPVTESIEDNIIDDSPDFDIKKWLYSFRASNEDGDKKRFYILKPDRYMRQAGEVEYARQLAMFVKAGLLPKAAWSTILDNSGGTISIQEADTYSNARKLFFEYSIRLGKLNQKDDKTPEDINEIVKLDGLIEECQQKMQSFELEQIYIFENTAEAKARNATIQWWLVHISYDENGKKFFEGNSVNEQLDWYDSLDPEKESFTIKVAQRFNYLITLWFLNRVADWKDFKKNDTV